MRRPLHCVCAMLVLLGLGARGMAIGVQPIPVDVIAPPDVTDSLVRRICTEADMIWAPAGVTFEWHRVVATTSPWRLHVTIEDRRKAADDWSAALGWVTVRGERVEPSIYLSRASVEDLLLRTAGHNHAPLETHDVLVGRALGRALSHELGHYLLKVKGHTAHGLMRATWPSDEFFAINRSGFELSSEERDAAVQIVPLKEAPR
jgi:hypothetical protein